MATHNLKDSKTRCQDCDAHNERRELAGAALWNLVARRHILGALNSFRSQVESPRQNQSNREPEQSEHYHRSRDCIRKMKSGHHRRRDLHDQPADNGVSDRNFVNIAPLELGEETCEVHRLLFVDGFWFWAGEDLLEARVLAQRVPLPTVA